MTKVKLIIGDLTFIMPKKPEDEKLFKELLIDICDPEEEVIVCVGKDREVCKLNEIFTL